MFVTRFLLRLTANIAGFTLPVCLFFATLVGAGEKTTDSSASNRERVWSRLLDMPTARLAAGAIAFDGKLYVIGGCVVCDGKVHPIPAVEVFSPATGTWEIKASLPTPRSNFGLATAGGRIFVIGGTRNDSRSETDIVEAYDPAANSWSAAARMPTPRCQVGAASIGGKIYAIGGNAGHEHAFEVYDSTTDLWSPLSPLPNPRRDAGVAALDGKIYVSGGLGYDGKYPIDALQAYDPATNRWSDLTPAHIARCDSALVTLDSALVAIGGYHRGPIASVEEYDVATNKWTTTGDLPAPTQFHSAAVLDGRIYVAGGSTHLPEATAAFYVRDSRPRNAASATPAEIPMRYWSLSTGSHIAYLRVAATGATKRSPVIFIHGGPGACEVYAYAFAHTWYERLAAQGFDVYLYDQIGSGYSARLPDPRDYTLPRHVADLEAIRRQIGSEQMILIGESHGATLSAAYLAAYPDRVERAIFVAPGALDPAARKAEIFPYATPRVAPDYVVWAEQTRSAETLARLRQLDALLRHDVVAAYTFAGDAEMDRLFEAFIKERILRTCVHDQARLRERNFEIPGMGWWASTMTTWDGVTRRTDAKARLAACQTPVLILRGDSDYLPADIADEYAAVFPRANLIRISAAGHFIWMDQPGRYRSEIEAFLTTDVH